MTSPLELHLRHVVIFESEPLLHRENTCEGRVFLIVTSSATVTSADMAGPIRSERFELRGAQTTWSIQDGT